VSWREDYDGDREDEAERELERARAEDRNRTGGPSATATLLPRLSGSGPSRCHRCGYEAHGSGFAVAPDGGRILCAWRSDETGRRIDCHDSADRQNADRLGAQVDRVREIVRDAKTSNSLGDIDKKYLVSVGLRDTVVALEKRIQEYKEKSAASPRGRGRDRDL
jgi:hypothetical protein